MNKKKILILGASGMLGFTVFKQLFADNRYNVFGTIRKYEKIAPYITEKEKRYIIPDMDAHKFSAIESTIEKITPDVIINCIGIIKQIPQAKDPLESIYINALFPHKIVNIIKSSSTRLIHISTDCVFNGKKGNYCETDSSDAEDLYGRTKYLGEVTNWGCITIRTSIIGHELNSSNGLLEWFLKQTGLVEGYANVFFSGLPTTELSNIIGSIVIPDTSLSGLYHIVGKNISKFDLLTIIKKEYGKKVTIEKNTKIIIDRTLNGEKFKKATGYESPLWNIAIKKMHDNNRKHFTITNEGNNDV